MIEAFLLQILAHVNEIIIIPFNTNFFRTKTRVYQMLKHRELIP